MLKQKQESLNSSLTQLMEEDVEKGHQLKSYVQFDLWVVWTNWMNTNDTNHGAGASDHLHLLNLKHSIFHFIWFSKIRLCS